MNKNLDPEIKSLQLKLNSLYNKKREEEKSTGFGNLSLDHEIKETEKDLDFLLKQFGESL